ncbi:MAG: hypothetical protein A2925_01680 [Candidatus Yanofskybacteria bacterium RIFCSPLOWO2_01_FULL_44_22]|uniref:Uncharacterized protein n=1 Tax=Candidatus Yanofskybacteria bacterium RIFCSPLOWO2_01_FULL_44_22 TaxID=1802697 RepID=A0A1F8GLJ0_9BACT|nr:MAG: hypothetical protein A2925_01680 [Candidatus Yanofskybacteria bacterium RIFCSPLOWO2_01_FULL_44_22]
MVGVETLACTEIPPDEQIQEGKKISLVIKGIGEVALVVERASNRFIRGGAKIRETYRTLEVWYDPLTRAGSAMAY